VTIQSPYRLNLSEIEASLRDVQRNFPQINAVLKSRREAMTDEVVEHMMAGYAYVDYILSKAVDLFDMRYVYHWLELNHIVLCGIDAAVRQEYHTHIELTTQRFYAQEKGYDIGSILDWYHKHRRDSVWKRAAGIYVRMLSQPQLFFEGNHRTGALVMSYLLVQDGQAPFVLTVENAEAYFNPSTLIKETQKTRGAVLAKLPRMKKRFANFIQYQTQNANLLLTPTG
jgi:hypothetical protein